MTTQLFPTWRDENAKAQFPFSDSSSLTSIFGVAFPQEVILDAVIYGANLIPSVYLSRVEIKNNRVMFELSNGDGSILGQGYWPPPLNTDQSVINILDSNKNSCAVLVVNVSELNKLVILGDMIYLFQTNSAEFVIACHHLIENDNSDRQVDGIKLPEQGDVYLVAEHGIQFQAFADIDRSSGAALGVTHLVVHAVGDPLATRSDCSDTFIEPRFITEVVFQKDTVTHSCHPANLGDIVILASSRPGTDSALRIINDANGISIGLFGKQLKSVK